MFFLHLDTLHFSAIPRDAERYKMVREDLLKAKNESGIPFFRGCKILEGKNKTQYDCGISFEGFNVFFADPEKVGSAYPVYVEVSAERMLVDWDNPHNLLEISGSCVGGFSNTKSGRCDITVDTDQRNFTKEDTDRFFTKSHTLCWILMGLSDDPKIKLENYERRSIWTGFTFGSGCSSTIYFRLYNKLEQLKRLKIDGSALFNLWKYYNWDGETNVWRFEWEMKREKLKNFGVETVPDLYRSLNRIYKHIVTEWMTFTDIKNSKFFWKSMQNLKFNYDSTAPREFTTKLDLRMFDRQIVGLLKRIAYEHKLDHSAVFAHCARLLSNYEDEICEWMNTAEEQKKEARINGFIDASWTKSPGSDT